MWESGKGGMGNNMEGLGHMGKGQFRGYGTDFCDMRDFEAFLGYICVSGVSMWAI